MSRRLHCALLCLAAAAAAVLPAAADVFPNDASGIKVEQVLQSGAVDNINLFNGSLTLSIPLGQQYHVGGNLTYQFVLTYNSDPWTFGQRFDQNYNTTFTDAFPSYCSNAGLGWRVSFGRLFTPCVPANQDSQGYYVYEAPDGSQHIFYATLHTGDADDPGDTPGSQKVLYTRDGSYLRLSLEPAGTWLMEFPDGTMNRFNSTGQLLLIFDRFGNQVSFNYATASEWILTDSQGRVNTVYFRADLMPYGQTVDHLTLATFNGSTATYQFQYYPAVALYKGCPFNDPPSAGYTTNQTSAPLLAAVVQPDGSKYSIPLASYNTAAPPSGELCTGNSGAISSLTLPTLGQLQWTYQVYSYPVSSSRPWRAYNYGVATRTMINAQGALVGTWHYGTTLSGSDLINSITDPLGNRTERHFSVSVSSSLTDPSVYSYGAPFSPTITAPGNSALFLSSQTFDSGNHLLRSQYVSYQHDTVQSAALPDAANNNRRLATSRMVYEDDGETYTESDMSSFDGLGHYRWTRNTGNFGPGPDLVVGFNYNPAAGVYDINQATNGNASDYSFVMLPASSPWILNLGAWQQVTAGASTSLTEFCYSAANGYVYRTRIHAANGAADSSNDILVLHTPDSHGNTATQQFYGGNLPGQALPGGATCTLGGTGQPALPPVQYQINDVYSYGSLATSQYSGASFYSVNRTIDPNTGLTASSRDTAGVQTNYQYDFFGRLTYVLPAADAYTQFFYTAASSPTALAKLTIQRQQNGAPSTIEGQKVLWFDDFGRPQREDETMPGGAVSSRYTNYNALGWKTSETVPGGTTATQYLGYDPFGRPSTIVPPDGAGHEVTLKYFGIRQVNRTVSMGETWTGSAVTETPVTTTEYYDSAGRLSQVVEPGGGLSTTYTYDAGNRITGIVSTGGGGTQNRSFTYDMRGFLQSATEPERGGSVSYSLYDTFGHLGRRNDGINDLSYSYDNAGRLTTIYKTFTTPACTSGGANCLKAFTYDTGNFNGFSNGRLITAQRWNFPVLNGTQFVELFNTTYTYSGLGGRLSQKTLALVPNGDTSQTAHESFVQSWVYDDLGDVVQENYPNCGPQFINCTGSLARSVSAVYSYGRMTSLTGYTGTVPGQPSGVGITYWPNGLVSQVAHSNGVLFSEASDASGIVRPGGFSASGAGGTLWSTGTYSYDGAGDVTRIGGSYFLYDNLARLTSAQGLSLAPTGGATSGQSFTYDAFGNLQSYSGTIGLNTSTTTQTNHLTGGTYDAAGNLRSWNGATYDFDNFNMLAHYKNGAQEWLYLYDADDQRVWQFQVGAAPRFDRWTLRGLDGRVRRIYEVTGWTWTNWTNGNFAEDLIYRGPFLLAGYYSTGQQLQMDVDHVGSIRLITNSGGTLVHYHAYYPFGEEATPVNQDSERIKFTGQERDLAAPTSDQDDLDYMHARHYSLLTGRFLSAGPPGGDAHHPQTWNLFAYAYSNPLKYTDPSGLDEVDTCQSGDTTPSCSGSIDVITTPAPDLSGFYSFLLNSSLFISGGANALSSNFLFGAGRYNIDDRYYRSGQLLGDTFSVPLGLEEALFGGTGEAAGLLLDATGGGAVVGIPVNVLSGALIVDGGVASGLGFIHTMSAIKDGGGSSEEREATPTSDPDKFGPVRGSNAKVNKDTGEIWVPDRLHKDHWEVYDNKKAWENGQRDRAVWSDGTLKQYF